MLIDKEPETPSEIEADDAKLQKSPTDTEVNRSKTS